MMVFAQSVGAHQETKVFSRIIRFLAIEAAQTIWKIGNPFAMPAII